MRLALASALALAALTVSLEAKQARCYTTDDGFYACEFRQYGGDGSFVISAPTKPTFTVDLVGRGDADAFADYGTGRNVPLPGPFLRSQSDRACWVSQATEFTICAY